MIRAARGAGKLFCLWLLAWAAIVFSHWGLLRLPYYWDEAGYYIPAAYDFFRLRTLIPVSTLSNAHPPLPSIYLSACWSIFGFRPLVTRLAVAAVAALALLAVYRIARNCVPEREAAVSVTLLTLLYPVWFVQSTLAHADIFAAAAALWALAFLTRPAPRFWPAGLFLTLAVLSKETAAITALAVLLWFACLRLRRKCAMQPGDFLALLLAPAALVAWYAYHWRRTGYVFGNPEYLRYNASATLHAAHILYAGWLRIWHVAGHMNLFVPLLISLAVWLLPRRNPRTYLWGQNILLVVFAANLVAFSVLGGAILTRYLLALFPLVLLFHVAFWHGRTRWWPLAAGATAAAFIAGLFWDPPYQCAAEDNLAYAASIHVDQQAIARVEVGSRAPVVLTRWPLTDYLSKPELGYVTAPVAVLPVENFSLEELLQSRPQSFSDALIFFPLKPRPPATLLHHDNAPVDLPGMLAARILGGELVWQTEKRRQYAAVIKRNSAVDADLQPTKRATPTFIMATR